MAGEMYEVEKGEKGGGCYVSTAVGFLMLLLAIAIAVGVGLIVFFAAGGREVVCNCQSQGGSPTPSQEYLMAECKRMAQAGNVDICGTCQADTSTMTAPPITTTTDTTTTTTKPGKVTDVRIPLHLYPVHFNVEIKPNMYEGSPDNFTFDGYVRVQLRCDTPTDNVTLHAVGLHIHNSTLEFGVENGTAAAPSIVRWDYDKDRQFMVIHLDGTLVKDAYYYVKMNYSAPLTDSLAGLYLSNYRKDNRTMYVATTQFQPTDARKAFPCYGEPAIKSYFDITLVRKSHMTSLSNMPIIRSDDRGDDWVADVFQTTPKMPVYLLAFVVSDFDYAEQNTSNGVLFRTWSRDSSVNQTDYALENGVKILPYFEEYFDIEFPLPKQDMLAIPDFSAGAMENWGLIIYREDVMLYNPEVSSERNKEFVVIVVAHELAHQWFGNLVSPSWWDDLWLNEGFASYMEYKGTDFAHPDWKMWDQFSFALHQSFRFDGLMSSHPVFVPVGHPDEIYEIFDIISYNKGAAVVRMMEFFLGQDTFRRGLSKYLKSLAYGAAFHDDLWNAMTKQATLDGQTIDVKAVMDTWTLQMNYPVVMVTQTADNKIKVTQQRFLFDQEAEDPGTYKSDYGYKWDIPFAFTTSKERIFNKSSSDITWIMRDKEEMQITTNAVDVMAVENRWIVGNPMQTGYYRVNYDAQNWQALVNQLKTDHTMIHSVNRAQILNDAWSLARARMLPQEVALQTLEYLDKEMEYVPWRTAVSEISYLSNMLENTAAFGQLEAFLKSKVEPPFSKMGLNSRGASHLEIYLIAKLTEMACAVGVSKCVDESLRLYREWMHNPSKNNIDVNLRKVVYCNAIRYGGSEEWDFAFQQYLNVTVATDSDLLLSAMGCSRVPWILSRYVERALDPKYVRKQDAFSVFRYVSGNPIGQIIARNHFMSQYDGIISGMSGITFAFNDAIGAVTSRINTKIELDQLTHFIATHDTDGNGKRAFQQAVEKGEANIKWMENNLKTIQAWLDKQDTSPTPTTQEKVTDVRLPMHLYPIHYDVEVRPEFYNRSPENFSFEGKARIQLRCDVASNNVTLHTNRLVINNSSLEFGAEPGTASTPSIVSWEWDKDRQFMVIHLDGMLVVGGLYYVKMNYTSVIKDDFAGIYYSSYTENNETKYLATTQFQPTDARKAFPCFGEPAIKSYFNITIVRKSHMNSLSNMPRQRSEDRGDDWIADVFETTAKMPVYLVAMVVSEFASVETTTPGGTMFRSWSRPDAIDQSAYAQEIGVDVLTYYEEYFDIPYPLPKQDMVALPDFVSSAMENWGLIVYRESAMLYQPGVSTQRSKQTVAEVIAHELGHQWFGNLVSPSWWDDLWLNEGFATFEQYLGVAYKHPDWKMWEQFTLLMHDVFNFDGLISSHPLFVPVGHPDEIYEIFDDISYKKGASVIRLMQFFLGEETFRLGLGKYLKKLAYGAATHDDLWESLTEQAAMDNMSINVKDVMDTWTLQMNYPVVMVTRAGPSTLLVTQQRYLRDPSAPETGKYNSPYGYKWEIPFTFTTSNEGMFNKTHADITWMRRTHSQVQIMSSVLPDQSDNSSWIVGNPMQTGYYRVNYEIPNWRALINQLKTDHTVIHINNRGQIINDAWNLATAGMLPLDIALESVEYLDQELDFIPWRAALSELKYLKRMLGTTGTYGAFQMFMKSIVERPFNILGMNNTGASHLESFARAELASTACEFGVQSCIDESLRLYRQWMSNAGNNPIDPDLKSTVYCTAIRAGAAPEWDFAFKQYEESTVAAETALLLQSLGCSQEPWIISRFLERALSGRISKQDALDVFSFVSRNPIGQNLAWEYFASQWDLITKEFASSFFAFIRVIGDVTSSFNSQSSLNALKMFIQNNPNQGTGTRAFQQAVEKTQANINWVKTNMPQVKTWLRNLGFDNE